MDQREPVMCQTREEFDALYEKAKKAKDREQRILLGLPVFEEDYKE
jgi:hypothetical protein